MGNRLRTILFLILAQAALVVRSRLAAAEFTSTSVVGMTAAAALCGALVLALVRRQQLLTQSSPKAWLWGAATAAAFGLGCLLFWAAHDDLAPESVALGHYFVPLAVIGVAALLRQEAFDRLRGVTAVLGLLAAGWFLVGVDQATKVVREPEAALLMVGASLFIALALVAAKRLAAAASVEFGAFAILVTIAIAFVGVAGWAPVVAVWHDLVGASSAVWLAALAVAATQLVAACALLLALKSGASLATVGATAFLAAPLAAVALLAEGGSLSTMTQAGIALTAAAFAVMATRDA